MEKLLIIYYTGTYNTKYIVNEINHKLKTIYEITIFDITSDSIINTNDYKKMIICYPIYAFNAPKILEKYIKNARISNIVYWIIKNSGEPLRFNDASSYIIKKHLKSSIFMGEYHLLMPYNIIFRHNDNMVKQMLLYNDRYLDYIQEMILSNKKNDYKISFKYKIFAFFGRIQRFGAKVNSHLYKVNKSCTHCMKCVSNCPVKAIEFKQNKIKVHSNCLMCMRCSFYCPVNAIKIGFLNKWKVNTKYDFDKIINSDLDGKYLNNCSKKFYNYYHSYYEELDILLKIYDY